MSTSESTLALAIFAAIFYGTWKYIEKIEAKERAHREEGKESAQEWREKMQQEREEHDARYERLVVALEKIAENGAVTA